jgi:hypothetical protein
MISVMKDVMMTVVGAAETVTGCPSRKGKMIVGDANARL